MRWMRQIMTMLFFSLRRNGPQPYLVESQATEIVRARERLDLLKQQAMMLRLLPKQQKGSSGD